MNVLIVGDPGLARDGLGALLSTTRGFKVVGALADSQVQPGLPGGSRPDILLLDVTAERDTNAGIIAQMKARTRALRVLVLLSLKDDRWINAARRAGADGYILKHEGRQDLFSALRNMAAGLRNFRTSVASRKNEELSERERQVIRLIASGHRTREMAHIMSLSPKTVEKHRTSLMRKLGLRNASAAAAFAIANGYMNE